MTLAEALAELKTRQQSDPAAYPPGATEAQIAAAGTRLSVPIPLAWQQVLRVTNAFYSEPQLEFYGADEIETTEDYPGLFAADIYPPHLIIAGEGSGDLLTLNTSLQTPDGDCPVAWVEHDGGGNEDDAAGGWRSIPEFLAWMFSVGEADGT